MQIIITPTSFMTSQDNAQYIRNPMTMEPSVVMPFGGEIILNLPHDFVWMSRYKMQCVTYKLIDSNWVEISSKTHDRNLKYDPTIAQDPLRFVFEFKMAEEEAVTLLRPCTPADSKLQ